MDRKEQSNNIQTQQSSRRVVGHQATASTLQALRAMQPKRLLTWTEAKASAARQANRLRARHEGNHDLAFDAQIIADQLRLLISTDDQMTMAGSSHWTGSHWQVLLNANDHPLRRRFTLAHEYKHIIDHGTPVDPELEERICDHFAACLLMPKQKVISAWTDPGIPQTSNEMATAFAVSSQAMRYRLHELGLLERTYQRCGGVRLVGRDQSRKTGTESIYYRSCTRPVGEGGLKGKATMKTAAIYLRVSSKSQVTGRDSDGLSIKGQREACIRKTKDLGAELHNEYIDKGESARSAARPALQKMLLDLAEHKIDYVIVHKLDRLARNRGDDVTINLAIREAGGSLVSCSENIDETPSGMLLHGVIAAVSEFYSNNLASEVEKGVLQKLKAGGTPKAAPLGYLNHIERAEDGRDFRTIIVDPERGPHVRWAFETYATGNETLKSLQLKLQERGLRTRPTKKRVAKPVTVSALQHMLRNPVLRRHHPMERRRIRRGSMSI